MCEIFCKNKILKVVCRIGVNMQKITYSFMLLWSTLSFAATTPWPEMDASQKDACFRAQTLNQEKTPWHNHKEFKSKSQDKPQGSYADFYKDNVCADMIFGTACTSEPQYYDMFMPSCGQVRRLMHDVQGDVVRYLTQECGIVSENDWEKVVGIYPTQETPLGVDSPTRFKKIPCTNIKCIGQQVRQNISGMPEQCVLFCANFNVGRAEYAAIIQVLDALLPDLQKEQREKLNVTLATAYLQNGGAEEGVAVFQEELYFLGGMEFRGSLCDRLMMHAKLHIMDDFLAQPEQTESHRKILSLPKEDRGRALRKIFDESLDLTTYAYGKYIQYVNPQLIYGFSVDDFVRQGWIEKNAADNMQIALPHTSVSAHKGLDLKNIVTRYVCRDNSILYCLAPIFYIPSEGMILPDPAGHVSVLDEHDLRVQCEANILTLHPDGQGHHKVEEGWLELCRDRCEWDQDETIGVILLDPYDVGGKSFSQCRRPIRASHPDLLEDVQECMQQDLAQAGYKSLFLRLSYDGFCREGSLNWSRATCPFAQPKCPLSYKLIDETVRVVWSDEAFLQSAKAHKKSL